MIVFVSDKYNFMMHLFLSLFSFWHAATNQNPKTSTMPGLINKENRGALPLSVSDITSCVRGYTLAMTASMTYENIEDHAIEGEYVHDRGWISLLQPGLGRCERQLDSFRPTLCSETLLSTEYACLLPLILFIPPPACLPGIFIYPLEENSIVVGFESMISSQIITLQIKDKAKIEDCYLDCYSTSNGALQSGTGKVKAARINFSYLINELNYHMKCERLVVMKPQRVITSPCSSTSSLCGVNILLDSKELRKEGRGFKVTESRFWCKIVVPAVLKSVKDAWRNTLKPNTSTLYD